MKKLIFLFLLSFSLFAGLKDVEFSSYGRIGLSSNFDGSSGKRYSIVSDGSRIELSPYQELGIKYNIFNNDENKIDVDLYFTLAFTSYNHYTGDFSVTSTIRQFYIDFKNIFIKNLSFWVGSRLYRGDDIYLFDIWPLDNLNTYGAGVIYEKSKYSVKFHLGVNRLEDEYQHYSFPVPLKGKPGLRYEDVLDRQRYIASLNVMIPLNKMKLKLYGEYHIIGDKKFQKENEGALIDVELPFDQGFVIGTQFTLYNFAKNSFLSLFLKYSRGLAAFGERGIPFGDGNKKKASGANNLFFGINLNYEKNRFALMLAAYYRYFNDADDSEYDEDDFQEAIFDIRGLYYITDIFHIDLETSIEFRKTKNLDLDTNTEKTPMIWKLALMPTISPKGIGNNLKPDFRLVYVFSYLNEGAAHLFNKGNYHINNYIGILSEWWF